jgi:3-carboxy-cis,cis-muconate cycloisomerase
MAEAAEGLRVDAARMRQNIEATHGSIFAEKAMMLLGAALGRDSAYKIVEEATRKSAEQGRRLAEVLGEMGEVTKVLDSKTLRELDAPEKYLGVAENFRKRLVAGAMSRQSKKK